MRRLSVSHGPLDMEKINRGPSSLRRASIVSAGGGSLLRRPSIANASGSMSPRTWQSNVVAMRAEGIKEEDTEAESEEVSEAGTDLGTGGHLPPVREEEEADTKEEATERADTQGGRQSPTEGGRGIEEDDTYCDLGGLSIVQLLQFPLFQGLSAPQEFFESLALELEPRTLGREVEIITMGAEGNTEMYFLRRGKAEVLIGKGKDCVAVAMLGPGAYFGEAALISERPRNATVRAVSNVDVYVLSIVGLDSTFHKFPVVGDALTARMKRWAGDIMVDKLLEIPLLQGLQAPEGFFEALAAECKPRGLDSNVDIITMGAEGDTEMYFLRHGEADVLIGAPPNQTSVATLGPGAFFGEAALISNKPRNATIRTVTDGLELYALSAAGLDRAFQAFPVVGDALRGRMRRWAGDEMVKRLQEFPLLQGLNAPKLFFETLAMELKPRAIDADEEIITVGSEGDSEMHFMLFGEVEVLIGTEENRIAILGEGAYFGEAALISDKPRNATVRAMSDGAELFALSSQGLDRAFAKFPAVGKALRDKMEAAAKAVNETNAEDAMLRKWERESIEKLLSNAPAFCGMSEYAISQLAQKVATVTASPGDVLMREGEEGDCMYIIQEGTMLVTVTNIGFVAQLDVGDQFGESTVLNKKNQKGRRAATVRVAEHSPPASLLCVWKHHVRENLSESECRKAFIESQRRLQLLKTLKSAQEIKDAVLLFWNLMRKLGEEMGLDQTDDTIRREPYVIRREPYVQIHMRMSKILSEKHIFAVARAEVDANCDWIEDFAAFSGDPKNSISLDEAKQKLKQVVGDAMENAKDGWKSMFPPGVDKLDSEQFISAIYEKCGETVIERDVLTRLFWAIDADDSNFIEPDEFAVFMNWNPYAEGMPMPIYQEAMFQLADLWVAAADGHTAAMQYALFLTEIFKMITDKNGNLLSLQKVKSVVQDDGRVHIEGVELNQVLMDEKDSDDEEDEKKQVATAVATGKKAELLENKKDKKLSLMDWKDRVNLAMVRSKDLEKTGPTLDKPFPVQWGDPPHAPCMAKDLMELPAGYGKGSKPLVNWVQSNLTEDEAKKAAWLARLAAEAAQAAADAEAARLAQIAAEEEERRRREEELRLAAEAEAAKKLAEENERRRREQELEEATRREQELEEVTQMLAEKLKTGAGKSRKLFGGLTVMIPSPPSNGLQKCTSVDTVQVHSSDDGSDTTYSFPDEEEWDDDLPHSVAGLGHGKYSVAELGHGKYYHNNLSPIEMLDRRRMQQQNSNRNSNLDAFEAEITRRGAPWEYMGNTNGQSTGGMRGFLQRSFSEGSTLKAVSSVRSPGHGLLEAPEMPSFTDLGVGIETPELITKLNMKPWQKTRRLEQSPDCDNRKMRMECLPAADLPRPGPNVHSPNSQTLTSPKLPWISPRHAPIVAGMVATTEQQAVARPPSSKTTGHKRKSPRSGKSLSEIRKRDRSIREYMVRSDPGHASNEAAAGGPIWTRGGSKFGEAARRYHRPVPIVKST